MTREFGSPLFGFPTFDDFWPVHFENRRQLLSTDMVETKEAFVYTVDVPGVNKDQVNLSLNDDILVISADYNVDQKSSEDSKFIWRERHTGHARKRISLPRNRYDPEGVKAKHENGVLVVTIPKLNVEQMKKNNKILIE